MAEMFCLMKCKKVSVAGVQREEDGCEIRKGRQRQAR
jgi:hypothetical protein